MHAQDRGRKPQETDVAGAHREGGGEDAAPRLAGQPGPGLLANRSAVQALRRLVGNRAVSQLIARSAEGEPTASEPPHETSAAGIHETAAEGVATPAGDLPHRDRIQESFGRHNMEGVRAHFGDGATASALAIGAEAYTSGEHVVFAGTPTLETAAHEAAHIVQQRQGVDLPGGVGRTGDAYERHADAVAGEVASGGSAEALLGAPRLAVAGMDGTGSPAPVQRKPFSDPNDPAIRDEMQKAGITSFGPYIWEDAVPIFKVDPNYAFKMADCVNAPIAAYHPETVKHPKEKGNKDTLIQNRRKAALKKLFDQTQGLPVLDDIMAHDGGNTPRPFASLAAEDGITGGHTVERHILGKGVMTDTRKVALRAAFWSVNGIPMPLDTTGSSASTASVWKDEATANDAVKKALADELAANWSKHRATLAKGTPGENRQGAPLRRRLVQEARRPSRLGI